MEPLPLLVIVGPTAVGKSAVALEVAERLDGEIISADSRQLYRGFDIGTAKPSAAERARVPHHFVDHIEPDAPYTLADFQAEARQVIADVAARGRLPILSGGTGLYVRALLRGWTIPATAPDPARREALKAEAAAVGTAALHARLAQVDPVAASRIEPTDLVRIVRALEVYATTGRPISQQQQANPPAYRLMAFGLDRPRVSLYARIDRRVEQMVEQGLIEEAAGLLARFGPAPLERTLGYAECLAHLQGHWDVPSTVTAIQRATRRYAKRQLTWFRGDAELQWLDLGDCATLAGTVEAITRQAQGLRGVTPSAGR